ncbi:response regulator [Salibacterium salarium]|uniref:Response regulator n=1 Tax=Salibacterium salarium TaxID=284579 RepID=A0A3R9PX91_9BACI|nr:response regulator [Salibacterium salarium]RSL28998.1 response regulator [Salibacterium salarium]
MYKILIVDDQYGIRVLLKEILQKDGHTIFEASNGIQALDVLEKETPDLMLLDMKIPGMDGVEILQERSNRQVAPDTQVVLMTAYGELNMMNEAKKLGACSYIPKPFDIDEVRSEIEKRLP